MKKLVSGFILGCLTLIASSATARDRIETVSVRCESQSHQFTECDLGSQVVSIGSWRQISDSPCIMGLSFGFYSSKVWVNQGCRADFQVDVAVNVPDQPTFNSCQTQSVDGPVSFSVVYQDSWSKHVKVDAPRGYTWVVLANGSQVVADPYNVSCEERSGPCQWTFVVPNFQPGFVTFYINATDNQWWRGQALAGCFLN